MTSLIEELATRFAAAQSGSPKPLSTAEWTAIAVSVVRGLGTSLTKFDPALHSELIELVRAIKAARDDIASLRPEEIDGAKLASANDELDAIVAATETATNAIMNAAEAIEKVAAEIPPEQGAKLTDAVTAIYEACSFQDITGQRVSKVVKVLHFIEERVQRMVNAVVAPRAGESASRSGKPQQAGDTVLLNGPQLAGAGHSQDEIDALLNGSGA